MQSPEGLENTPFTCNVWKSKSGYKLKNATYHVSCLTIYLFSDGSGDYEGSGDYYGYGDYYG